MVLRFLLQINQRRFFQVDQSGVYRVVKNCIITDFWTCIVLPRWHVPLIFFLDFWCFPIRNFFKVCCLRSMYDISNFDQVYSLNFTICYTMHKCHRNMVKLSRCIANNPLSQYFQPFTLEIILLVFPASRKVCPT